MRAVLASILALALTTVAPRSAPAEDQVLARTAAALSRAERAWAKEVDCGRSTRLPTGSPSRECVCPKASQASRTRPSASAQLHPLGLRRSRAQE